MSKRKHLPIHLSLKLALGYDEAEDDAEILKDWKARTRRVCKPCWELKYCPYGPLVEQSPTLPNLRHEADEQLDYFKRCVETGTVGSKELLSDDEKKMYQEWLSDDQLLLEQAVTAIAQRRRLEHAAEKADDDEQIVAWLGGNLPPIHEYRVPFDVSGRAHTREDFDQNTWNEIQIEIEKTRTKYKDAVRTGEIDHRHPIEPPRLAFFKRVIADHDSSALPESIPSFFEDAVCNVFGHICPVFFAAEALTETSQERRIGRKAIPFHVRMRIVRRDNYTCQHCSKHLGDDEVEFDHIIPVSKGGSSEEHNIRLTCFECNRDKSDEYIP
jgi:hypothetical protein